MDLTDLFYRLAVSLAVGLLVGIERHWRERDAPAGSRTAGVRTFALFGFFGGITAIMAQALAPQNAPVAAIVLVAALAVLSVALITFKRREAEADANFSVTGVVAGQATFVLGALAVLGDPAFAGAAAVVMTALLASREVLHALLRRMRWSELRSAIVLAVMTFVALPLIPDEPLPQLMGLNPARVWLLAIILAGVSFLGYVAVQLFGAERGRLVAGATGGLVSSTAVTLANARLARAGEAALPLAAGALAAGAVSFIRTAVIVTAVAPELGRLLVPGLGLGAAVLVAGAWLLARREGAPAQSAAPEGGNPFELGEVLKLAALLAFVRVVGDLAAEHLGAVGVYAVAAVSGLADVDAVSLGVSSLVPDRLALGAGAIAIAIAVGSNTIAKCVYAAMLGGRAYAGRFSLVSLLALAALAAGLLAASAQMPG
ncbi:hypothetical protein AL346_00385 [Chelatococcus sp. CO-6]|uniref:MgtC/SapB family protein n=1 Tax=Chelatococcus sp. CO-6 TaxID=1702325 RepID=UPI00069F54E0|nr:DUF4010 domain-containing protein [Chelatococcus sp. CO-6]ALA16133.1 hypothetical protein AL346_00385 [Chelatococcus sp. CO-6]